MSAAHPPMSPRERLLAFLQHHPVDVRPALPITMMWAADLVGTRYLDYATKAESMAAAQIAVARRFGADQVSVISDPATEAADCGAEIFYPPDAPPAIDESRALLAEAARLASLRLPDPLRPGSRMANRIAAVRLLKRRIGATHAIEGWVEGPCAESADLRGINTLMLDFYDEPDFVRSLIDFVVRMALTYAAAQVEAGADTIGIGDAAASQISPDVYERVVLPREQRLVRGLKSMGAKVRMHICGNITHLLPGLASLGLDVLDVDHMVSLRTVRETMGPKVAVCGNLDPVTDVFRSHPDAIRAKLDECYRLAGNPFIVNAGCEIPSATPAENLRALCDPIAWRG